MGHLVCKYGYFSKKSSIGLLLNIEECCFEMPQERPIPEGTLG
jgi:hypothetical protein